MLRVPIAHGDGRYTADDATLDRLEQEGQVVFRYVDAGRRRPCREPNGSMRDIAGIVNDEGNVLGMMPHPERAVEPCSAPPMASPLFESLLARVAV